MLRKKKNAFCVLFFYACNFSILANLKKLKESCVLSFAIYAFSMSSSLAISSTVMFWFLILCAFAICGSRVPLFTVCMISSAVFPSLSSTYSSISSFLSVVIKNNSFCIFCTSFPFSIIAVICCCCNLLDYSEYFPPTAAATAAAGTSPRYALAQGWWWGFSRPSCFGFMKS